LQASARENERIRQISGRAAAVLANESCDSGRLRTATHDLWISELPSSPPLLPSLSLQIGARGPRYKNRKPKTAACRCRRSSAGARNRTLLSVFHPRLSLFPPSRNLAKKLATCEDTLFVSRQMTRGYVFFACEKPTRTLIPRMLSCSTALLGRAFAKRLRLGNLREKVSALSNELPHAAFILNSFLSLSLSFCF